MSVLILMHKTMALWRHTHTHTRARSCASLPWFWCFCTAAEIAYWHEQKEAGDIIAACYQPGLRRFQSESLLYRRYDDVYETVHDHAWKYKETKVCRWMNFRKREKLLEESVLSRRIPAYKSSCLYRMILTDVIIRDKF